MVKQLFSGLLAIALAAPVVGAAEMRQVGKAFLGVLVESAAKEAPPAGAVIREVAPESPAAKAGLKAGDRIVKVGNKDISDAKTLVEAVAFHQVGAALAFHVVRDGKEMKLEATLSERKPSERVETERPALPEFFASRPTAFLGVHATTLTPEMKKKLDASVEHGAVIAEVMADSPAAKAGFKADDIITHIDAQSVATPDDLRSAVRKAGAGKDVVVKFLRGKDAKEVKMKLGELPSHLGMLPDFDSRWQRFDERVPHGFDKEMGRRLEKLQRWLRELDSRSEEQSE